MNKKLKFSEIKFKQIIKSFLMLFIPVFILISGIIVLITSKEVKNNRTLVEANKVNNVNLQMRMIESSIIPIISDLKILASHYGMKRFLHSNRSSDRKSLEKEFYLFSLLKKFYDQIRYLNNDGMEIVRVNYNNGIPIVVPRNKLQSKKHRYYFKS